MALEVGSSSSATLIVPSAIPLEIVYVGVGLRHYRVPKVPLPEGALGFLGDRPNDEVKQFSFGFNTPLYVYSNVLILVFLFSCGQYPDWRSAIDIYELSL